MRYEELEMELRNVQAKKCRMKVMKDEDGWKECLKRESELKEELKKLKEMQKQRVGYDRPGQQKGEQK